VADTGGTLTLTGSGNATLQFCDVQGGAGGGGGTGTINGGNGGNAANGVGGGLFVNSGSLTMNNAILESDGAFGGGGGPGGSSSSGGPGGSGGTGLGGDGGGLALADSPGSLSGDTFSNCAAVGGAGGLGIGSSNGGNAGLAHGGGVVIATSATFNTGPISVTVSSSTVETCIATGGTGGTSTGTGSPGADGEADGGGIAVLGLGTVAGPSSQLSVAMKAVFVTLCEAIGGGVNGNAFGGGLYGHTNGATTIVKVVVSSISMNEAIVAVTTDIADGAGVFDGSDSGPLVIFLDAATVLSTVNNDDVVAGVPTIDNIS
jgi:hypothetical protein